MAAKLVPRVFKLVLIMYLLGPPLVLFGLTLQRSRSYRMIHCILEHLLWQVTQLLPVSFLSPKVLPFLLQTTHSVEVWSSLLPRLSSLSPSEIKKIIISVDQAVTFKTDFTTLFKSNSSALGSPTSSTTSFTVFQRSIVDDFAKLGSRVSLIQDNIGQDPGIADFPLRNPWEGLAFLKSSFSETVSKILPVLKQMTVPLSLLQVQSIVVK